MESVTLIKWFVKSKVIAQGCSTQDNETVECSRAMKFRMAIFEELQAQVV